MEQLKNHECVDYHQLEDELDWRENQNRLANQKISDTPIAASFILACAAIIIVLVFLVF